MKKLLFIIAIISLLPFSAIHADDDPITVIAVGDIMLSRGIEPFTQQYGYDYPYRKIADFLQKGDVVIGNLECYFSTYTYQQGTMDFKVQPINVRGLRYAGFNVVTLANNHVSDAEPWELKATRVKLYKNNIKYCGAGSSLRESLKPAIIKTKGKKVAVIACSMINQQETYATKDKSGIAPHLKIVDEIKRLRVFYDYVIVSCHWGDELTDEIKEYQKNNAYKFIDAGAELVIGHHPHVVQPVEIYKGRLIVYSLGNFIFDNPSDETSKSFMLEAKFYKRNKTFKIWPITRKRGAPKIASVKDSKEILEQVREISEELGTKVHIKDNKVGYVVNPLENKYIEVSKKKYPTILFR